MKKVLALVLAFMMIFSSISFTFADTTTEISAAKACETLGMLQGSGTGVTAEYLAGESTRLQAAIMVLRLMGLEKEAVAYVSDKNFADMATYAWADGKNVAGYLLAHPELGFVGDGVNFMPNAKVDEAQYYKVMLTALGYTQDVDYTWAEVITFAKSLGFAPMAPASFTNNDIARITMEALQAKNKAGVVLFKAMIAAGSMTEAKATEAGLMSVVNANLASAKALGNSVVQVTFDAAVDTAAEDVAMYAIDGLEVKSALVAGTKVVRLTTAAMTAGKLYTLTVGDAKVKFTGIAKDSDKPALDTVVSADVEEVVVTFKNVTQLDYASASDIANYTIAGVEVVKATIDGKKVTLTTTGLVNKKQYTLKVTNIKSVDGYLLKSESKSFYSRFDTTAPTVSSVTAKTNEKVVIVFNEELSADSAENIANYTIMNGTTELAIEKAELVEDDNDDLTTVELTTEPQKANARYTITIENIADATNAANTMTKVVTKTFYGKKADTMDPTFTVKPVAISRTQVLVQFTDASDFDETTVLDANNYVLTKGSDELVVEKAEKFATDGDVYKVLLTVEELNIGTYNLEAQNIADEFGNVMADKDLYFSVTRDSFASATVVGYTVVDSNTINVEFSKPLVEATAENLANYEFDNDLGSPVKAIYEDELDRVVTLDVTEFEQGEVYELTIAGVEDIAGNVLDLTFDFTAVVGSVDETAPELVDVYAINKNVVAVAFDEAVKFDQNGEDTMLYLAPGIELKAQLSAEDDTVIEFSLAGEYLNTNVDYTIEEATSLLGITDKAGNAFDLADVENLDEYVVYGNDEDPEAPEVLSIAQVDGNSFDVTMSRIVKEVVDQKADAVNADGLKVGEFDVTYDDDVVTFTLNGAIVEDDEYYVLDLRNIIKDAHGTATENLDSTSETRFYVEFEDEENPYIVNVKAVDRFTVEIEYNEVMGEVGSYTIKNADDTISKVALPQVGTPAIDDEFVTITVSTPLEGRYDYKLIVNVNTDKTNTAEDLVGNPSEEANTDEFYFSGTDLAPVEVDSVDVLADKAAAAEVDTLIAALPAVDVLALTDEAAVVAARTAYTALTAAQKAYVTKLSTLVAAENKIVALKDAAAEELAAQLKALVDSTNNDELLAALKAVTGVTGVIDGNDYYQGYNLEYFDTVANVQFFVNYWNAAQ